MLLAGTLAAAPMLSACNKPANEPDYQARVNDSLKDAQLKDVKADWKSDEKALHLSGEVEKAADKARAAELAKQVVGTSGRVVDEVKVEGSNIDEVDNLDLKFHTKAAVVTVTGTAPTQAAKDRVTERVRQIGGVKDVVNDLEIKPEHAKAPAARKK
jgi:osmotically-inducible protein OsmY